MIDPSSRVIVENELIWPTFWLETRLNDHVRDIFDAPLFMLFMGNAKTIRMSNRLSIKLNPKFSSYFDVGEIEFIYKNHTECLIEELIPDEDDSFFLKMSMQEFLTFLIYSSQYKRPFVAEINSLLKGLTDHRSRIMRGERNGNVVLASNIINFLSCYAPVSPYCVRPVEPNIRAATDLFGDLSRNVNYNILSRVTYKLGMQTSHRIGNLLEKTRSISEAISESEAFVNILAVTKSFVSFWFGPAGSLGADAVHKMASVIPITRYIPPIYDVREIHKAYDHFAFPDIEDYGGL